MNSLAKNNKYPLRCGICHHIINNPSSVYQSKILYIPVCENCRTIFSEADINLVLNMFLAYGGHFGQYPKEEFSLPIILKSLGIEGESMKTQLEEINIRMMHVAFLHGITPKEYISRLREILS